MSTLNRPVYVNRPVCAKEPLNPESDDMQSGLPDGRRDDGAGDENGGGLSN